MHMPKGFRRMIRQQKIEAAMLQRSEAAVLHAPAVAACETLEDGVHLDDGHISAGTGGLVLALASDPGLEGLQLLPERADLYMSKETAPHQHKKEAHRRSNVMR